MAYFKLSLLTSQFENNQNILLEDVISEFNTQENVYNSKQQAVYYDANNPIIWLPLDGDLSNWGSGSGIITGSSINYDAGKVTEKCLSNGTLIMPAALTEQVFNKDHVTIAFWFYNGKNATKCIFGQDNMTPPNNRRFTLYKYPTPNDLHWSWQNEDSSSTFTGGVVRNVLTLNAWNHICAVWNQGIVKLYVNGREVVTSQGVCSTTNWSYDTTIARAGDNDKYNDIRIYNISLSSEEVEKIASIQKITNFNDRKYSYCYSYNEKFSLTQNAQKTLSFDMDKFIIKDNLREENPFARNIIIGSQILLVDQYNNNYFFTVKNIDYDIKEMNIIYKISCQDTFSYQATRQNSGYTINNDSSEADFIGAKTTDWWVVNKIVPECHIGYKYLYMNNGLYEALDGSYKVFNYGDDLTDVKRIIKDAYSPDKDKDLYETIPFSCSGSNANAALISLGEILDLQLKTFEHISGLRYFWFEPKKNTNRIGGLIYSPYNSIQSFGLSHKGDSLTTIMNVEGPTYEDDIITLIPAITPHFSNFFLETGWTQNTYKKGMFLAQCEPQHYYLNNNNEYDQTIDIQRLYYTAINIQIIQPPSAATAWQGEVWYGGREVIETEGEPEIRWVDNGFLYIKLFDDNAHQEPFKFNSLFTHVGFNSGNFSTANTTIGSNFVNLSSNYVLWSLAFIDETEQKEMAFFSEGEDIKDYINAGYWPWIKIFVGKSITGDPTVNFNPNLSFSRDVSQEDIEFATAAEECPWLENKLIDFSYFLESKMITQNEYRDLMNWLVNRLRIVNGQLMFYAKAYYKALHDRTKILAELTNSLDALGAAANADIVTTLRTEGKIADLSKIDSFDNAYTDLLITNIQEEDKDKLLNYNDILTDYFNKYFSAEQRFLKNIKNFKDYFNSAPSTWINPSTAFYAYTLEICNPDTSAEKQYIFNNDLKQTTDGSILIEEPLIPYIEAGERSGVPCYNVYLTTEEEPNKAILQQVVTAENYKSFYIKNTERDDGYIPLKPGELYNSAWTYFYIDENHIIPDENIRKQILINLSNAGTTIKFRDTNPQSKSFDELDDVQTRIETLLGDTFEKDYKKDFPIKEVYKSVQNKDPAKYLFVNQNNYGSFYKKRWPNKWHQDWLVRYDVYKQRIKKDEVKYTFHNFEDLSNYIYCSSIVPDKDYESDKDYTTLGVTFSYAKDHGFFYKEKSFLRTVQYDEKPDRTTTYKVFEIREDFDTSVIESLFNSGVHGITEYWPIYDLLDDFDILKSFTGTITDDTTIEEVLTELAQRSGDSQYIWEPTSDSCPFTDNFIIVEITSYFLNDWDQTDYSRKNIYCNEDNQIINFTKEEFPIEVISSSTTYYHREEPYIHPTEDFLLTGGYYKKDGENNFSPIQTILELRLLSSPKYISPYKIITTQLTPYETKVLAPITTIKVVKNENNQIIDFQKSPVETHQISFTLDDEHGTPLTYYYLDGNIIRETTDPYSILKNNNEVWQTKDFVIGDVTLQLKLTKKKVGNLDLTTNGNLWYACTHGELSNTPTAVSIAASIEAQLEEYWQLAYTASLYCKYFLPESWQSNYSTNQNLFRDEIIEVVNQEEGTIRLKDTYIPEVSVYSENNNILLPKYYLSRKKDVPLNTDDKSIDNDTAFDVNSFKTNPIIVNTIEYLGDDIENFSASSSGNTTYYYIEDKNNKTGCTWARLMTDKVSGAYSLYSGIYELAYRLIQRNYLPLELVEYERLKQDKQYIWDTLYQTYGYIMLEKNYKDDMATTSSELMTLAKYAFKDYAAPERQYNITVIDATSLKGYKGDEIRVGDGIQIDAQAYYNEYDQIFKSLSQYLFITDISYTLRSPTDISLTVNSIKYQDKLIQRLVKLIK